ncbi:MAG TPA: phage head closure protein [Bryobacteraceae bacterium]|nr:phage head closure protein [Blastocatellia bacterium]HXJ40527.1 phage head closure protein [Bryobacteraceae bacterium]
MAVTRRSVTVFRRSIIDPGRLRHRVTIQKLQFSSPPEYDAAGPVGTPISFLTVWAAIEPARSTDIIRSGQTISEVIIPIYVRYRAGIAANQRVVFGSNSYVIQGIRNVDENNEWLELQCLALGANQ